jgi:ring-1,2-phenylacetyl-CoA epoxidase subunit PaaD
MVNAFEIAASVPDPELPMVTVADLGILRSVRAEGDSVTVVITPTYSGCPALREIGADLRGRLLAAGYREVTVSTELSPAWTTDWITPQGRRKLAAAGIAPPGAARHAVSGGPVPLTLGFPGRPVPGSPVPGSPVCCPRCGSGRTRLTSAFGATACKALYRCEECLEPFEHFKEI